MARPTARVLALLEVLQGGGVHPVGELAARLEVDERTIRRYVAHLMELGVPVAAVRGRHGGYRVAPGYRMPPLMLTDDEALALLLGLAAAQRSGAVPLSSDAAERAAAKLRRVLPPMTERRLHALEQTLAWTASRTPRPTPAPTDAAILLACGAAARERRPLAITYRDRLGHTSERTVLPYGVVAHAGRWYLAGMDSATSRVRIFRLDRVSQPVMRSGAFTIPDGFDAASFVLESLATAPWRHQVRLLVEADAEELGARLPPGLAVITPAAAPDGWTQVDLRAERLDWLPPLLAGLGRRVKVEQPAALRELLREYAARLMADAT